jgi:hypothetical protein
MRSTLPCRTGAGNGEGVTPRDGVGGTSEGVGVELERKAEEDVDGKSGPNNVSFAESGWSVASMGVGDGGGDGARGDGVHTGGASMASFPLCALPFLCLLRARE